MVAVDKRGTILHSSSTTAPKSRKGVSKIKERTAPRPLELRCQHAATIHMQYYCNNIVNARSATYNLESDLVLT